MRSSVRIHPRQSSNEGKVIKKWALAGCEIIMRSEWDVAPQLNSGALIRILAGYQLPYADNIALSTEGVGNNPSGAEQFIRLLKTSLALCLWKGLKGT